MPSREALIARVVSLALAPVNRIVSLATAPASGLMSQLKTLSERAPASEGDGEVVEGEAGTEAEAGTEPQPEAPAS